MEILFEMDEIKSPGNSEGRRERRGGGGGGGIARAESVCVSKKWVRVR